MARDNPIGKENPRIYHGARFGKLTVIERIPRIRRPYKYVYLIRCRCDCGNIATPESCVLLSGKTTSCGCHKRSVGGKLRHARSVASGNGYGGVVPGAVFGRLTVIERMRKGDFLTPHVLCVCRCGRKCEPTVDGIVQGTTQSCGCLHSDMLVRRNKNNAKHDCISSDKTMKYVWQTWSYMVKRTCPFGETRKTSYGTVAAVSCSWLRESPWHLAELIGERPTLKHTIDRFPIHDGKYTCGRCHQCNEHGWKINVRWATRKQQSENRGQFNMHISAFGKTKLLCDWEDETGIDARTLSWRIRHGWPPEMALSTPNKLGRNRRPVS